MLAALFEWFAVRRDRLATCDARRDRRNHFHFALGPGMPRRAAVAEADVIEHRLLRRRLRLFVAGEHRQDDRFLREAERVSRIQRRAHVNERVEFFERLLRERRVGVRTVEIAAEAEAELQLALSAPSMHAIVSRPGSSGA